MKTTGKLIMVAKKLFRFTRRYLFSIDPNAISQNAPSYIGTLSSNFFGSFYNLYDDVRPTKGKGLGRNVLSVNFVFLIIQLRTLVCSKRKEYVNLL